MCNTPKFFVIEATQRGWAPQNGNQLISILVRMTLNIPADKKTAYR